MTKVVRIMNRIRGREATLWVFVLVFIVVFLLTFAFTARGDRETVTYPPGPKDVRGIYKTFTWTWAANKSGNFDSGDSVYVTGRIVQALFGTVSGTTATAVGYDVTVRDSKGRDILGGVGANLNPATGATDYKTPYTAEGGLRLLVNEPLGAHVREASGTSPQGTFTLYVEE